MAKTSRSTLMIIAAVVVVAAGAVTWYVTRPHSVVIEGQAGTATSAAPAESSDALMVAGPLGEMVLGDANAPNTVIEYASMTCTHCQAFHANTYRAFKEKYVDTGKVKFIFREYPLDPLATAAIVVARCAPKEQYFPLVDLMFDKQREWAFVPNPSEALFNLVRQAGFTQESFKACLTNQEILDGVRWVQNRANTEFGVDSTPTFFINGKKVAGEQSLADLDRELGG